MGIAALSEVKRLGLSMLQQEPIPMTGQSHLMSGGYEELVWLSARLIKCIRQVAPVDERFIHIRLERTCGFMTVVAI